MKLNQENRKLLSDIKKELLLKQQQRENLINHNTDWGMLEEFIQECNTNPGLVIDVTTSDGTKLSLKTVRDDRKVNPLFTDAVYDD